MHVPVRRSRSARERAMVDVAGCLVRGISRRYHRSMRKPSLTIETFVAALAVLGAGTALGCGKADRATAAPEAVGSPAQPVAPSLSATAAAAPPTVPGSPPAATTPLAEPPANKQEKAAAPAESAPAKDGTTGSTKKTASPVRGATAPPAKPQSSGKSSSASCGAGMCTPEMKKGNGN